MQCNGGIMITAINLPKIYEEIKKNKEEQDKVSISNISEALINNNIELALKLVKKYLTDLNLNKYEFYKTNKYINKYK